MIRSIAFFTVLGIIVGCGSSADGDGRSASAAGGRAATGSASGGAASSGAASGGTQAAIAGAGNTTWTYANEDEGVFPSDRVLDIQVAMPEDAWSRLIATARQEVWSKADVTIDGQALGSIGFRPKGEYSLDSCVDNAGQLKCEKLSFKLKFNEIDPNGRFYGLKRLILNQVLDGAALFMEPLAYRVYNDFGITAPRTSFATLTVNGNSLGIYKVIEAVDGRFTDTHFADGNGNLYKEAWPDRTDAAYFASKLETNEETATNEAILAFATEMLAASDAALPGTLAKYMDLGQLVDYMAVDYAIANWDGITTFYAGSWGHANHNFYMYQSENAARFTLIPWDLNATFFLDHWLGDVQSWDAMNVDCANLIPTENNATLYTMPATCDPTIRAIALSKTEYRQSVRRLLDQVFLTERLQAQVDSYVAQVSKAMQSDPFVTFSEMSGGANYVKTMIPVLRARLEAVLSEPTGP